MTKKIVVNQKNCSGCKLCEMNCSAWHFTVSAPHLSAIRIIGRESHADFTPTLCQQCSDRFCVNSCPQEALTVNEITGAIMIDHETCVLCGACVSACPLNAITITTNLEGDEYLLVCDLCGGDPQCVKYCRLDAIIFE